MVFVPWGQRNDLSYASLAPIRDAAWAGLLADALAMVAVGTGLAVVVGGLVRGRGRAWATAGGALTSVGAVVFALGASAFASLVWHATDPAVLSPDQGTALLAHAEANPGHGLLLHMVGFLTFTVGTLLLAVALLRAGTAPRWLPAAVVVLTVLLFAFPGRPQDLAQAAQMLVFAAIGVVYLRSEDRA
ncbi:DUF4386 family protein [Ornithinimicrobium sp. W1665]|uniref:DUF4386 family protein n=2 Tax=Ornithinimicrobium sp. W1665 TaxID=3416666 RepID=UPI003D6A1779